MQVKNVTKNNSNKKQKRQHDIIASLRFLDNLHNEILIADKIEDINDPNILKKLSEVISFFKKELL